MMVVGAWAFATIWLFGMLVLHGELLTAFMLFFVAMAISVAVAVLPEGETRQRTSRPVQLLAREVSTLERSRVR
jgi:hypothetical protein